MGLLSWLFYRQHITVISEKATVIVVGHQSKPAHYIRVCIPVHNLFFTHKHLLMANQFTKVQKAPFTLQFLDVDGNVTTDPVSSLQGSAGDGTTLKVQFDIDAVTNAPLPTGWLIGVTDGVVDANFTGVNSKGNPVSGKVTITIGDGIPVVKDAASIGVLVGDPVAQ